MRNAPRSSLYRYTVRRQCIGRASESGGLGDRVFTPTDAARFFHRVWRGLPQDRECFVVAMIDAKNMITGFEVVAMGSLTGVEVHPREVFKAAMLMSAAAILVAHNHPSGDPTPSEADVDLTRRLYEAGKLIGIPVIDHVVIGADESYRVVSGCAS